jgi:hypothetical protein
MMQHLNLQNIAFVLLWLTLITCSSDHQDQSENKFISVPGTPVELAPPEEFISVADIGGFKHKRLTSSIMILESTTDFKTIVNGYSAEEVLRQGGNQLSHESVTVDSIAGMLFNTARASQGLNFMQWILVLPLSGHTLTINGTYLSQDEKEVSTKIKKAILSARIKKNLPVQNLMSFALNPGSLQFAKTLQGPSVMYTENGEWNDNAIFKLSFFAGPSSTYAGIEPTEEFAVGQLKDICAECKISEKDILPVTIDNLQGYEVIGYRADTSETHSRMKYEVILFDSNKYYLLVGTASDDYDKNLSMFRSISKSFKRAKS